MGEWNGALNMGSQTSALAPRRRRRSDARRSTASTKGNSAIPVATTTIEGGRITLAIPVIKRSFDGALRDGRIAGEFTQRGTLPLVFQRGEATAGAH